MEPWPPLAPRPASSSDPPSPIAGPVIDPRASLDAHESARPLQAVNGLVTTGHTGVNVNDLRMIILPPA